MRRCELLKKELVGRLKDAAAAPTAPVPAAAKRPRREEPRVRKGRELKEALGDIVAHFARDKKKQALQELAALSSGETRKDRTVRTRAMELRDLLFTFGSFNLTRAALDRFLHHNFPGREFY